MSVWVITIITVFTGISLARRSYLYIHNKPDSDGRPVRLVYLISLSLLWFLYAAMLGLLRR